MAECNLVSPLLRLRFPRGFYFIPTRWHHGWMKGFLILPVLLIFLFSTLVFADYAKGLDAYEKGDYATALKELEPLAEQGDADGQFALSIMYHKGQGVTQDYIHAHMWWNIAASQGHEDAVVVREIFEMKMTLSQIEKAQDLARQCVAKNYKDC